MPKKPKKPYAKAIKQYHEALKTYRDQGVKHEGAVETAFQRLLEQIAKLHHCQSRSCDGKIRLRWMSSKHIRPGVQGRSQFLKLNRANSLESRYRFI